MRLIINILGLHNLPPAMKDLKKLESSLYRKPAGGLGQSKPIPGRFKPGVYYPERVATQFKPGNYHGFTSIEEWGKSYKKTMPEIKNAKRAYRRLAKSPNEVQDLVRQHAEEAIKTLVDIMRNPESLETTKLQAVQLLLDRGYGKASQTHINANLDADAKPSQIPTVELNRRIADALERVEKLTSGAAEQAESPERSIDIRKYN